MKNKERTIRELDSYKVIKLKKPMSKLPIKEAYIVVNHEKTEQADPTGFAARTGLKKIPEDWMPKIGKAIAQGYAVYEINKGLYVKKNKSNEIQQLLCPPKKQLPKKKYSAVGSGEDLEQILREKEFEIKLQ